MILVDGGDADVAGNHDVGMSAGVADFVDALAGGEGFELDLGGEDGGFVVVEKLKERDVAQLFGIAGHGQNRVQVAG